MISPKGDGHPTDTNHLINDLISAANTNDRFKLLEDDAILPGVMRRGDLIEPHYRLDFPETEWGYAWENFMFGCIINPQDKNVAANRNGGKEYSDVPVSWIAQWFRTETWDVVQKDGPTAIAPPTAHFKIQISHQHAALYRQWEMRGQRFEAEDCAADVGNVSHLVYFKDLTATELQIPNVPIPQRVRTIPKPSMLQRLLASKKEGVTKPARSARKCPPTNNAPLVDGTSVCGMRRKRAIDETDEFLPPAKKHIRSPLSPAPGCTPINAPLIAAHRASSPRGTQWKQ
ncbi:hypothetical protein E8E12_003560 [Didymella heteroderae]|uniref:Uncharacterized protein n=1 Tax=Didymella heteroderae TaxID=1769908 RepID=A0A9P4WM41_9PLEO|nr:hypothetical protein E8E12_003560 [Didymella heteroderae]